MIWLHDAVTQDPMCEWRDTLHRAAFKAIIATTHINSYRQL